MNTAQQKGFLYRFITCFFLCNSLFFCLIGSEYLKHILLCGTLFKNSMVDYSGVYAKFFVLLFSVFNYLSYMSLLALLPILLLFLIALLFPYKRLIWACSILIATFCVTLLFIDSRVYAIYNFHLNIPILSILVDARREVILGLSPGEGRMFSSIIGLILLVECGTAWLVWKKVILKQRLYIEKKIIKTQLCCSGICFTILCVSVIYGNNLFSQQTPNLPLYHYAASSLMPLQSAREVLNRYSEEHFVERYFSNEKLHYPQNPLVCKKPDAPFNIIFIMIDSLRFDSAVKKHMPHLAQFGKNNWRFLAQTSGGNSTQPGVFSLFYSIPSNYWTAALKQKKSPVLLDLILKYGYLIRAFWSAPLELPPFNKTIYVGIPNPSGLYSSDKNNIGDRDRDVTQHAITFLKNDAHQGPFFLNLFYDAAHSYCDEQNFSNAHHPAQQPCMRLGLSNTTDPGLYKNRYLNAVHFIDDEVSQVLRVTQEQGYMENSIIIITSDHGEEFNDSKHNYWGHAGNFTDAQTHVPLMIHWPKKPAQTIDYATTSYDLVPTLFKHLFACQNKTNDYSIGQDLLLKQDRLPFILAGSYSNMGLIEPHQLTTLYTTGEVTITTPALEVLLAANPNMKNLKQALVLMRMYTQK
jgi:membrane-anchored protein YejM (alkaline phosphatase superfamily)